VVLKKATGERGSWFATVDGERLPCVHRHWWKNGRYCDPHVQVGEKKWDEFIAALISGKKAILTNDEPWNGSGPFIRRSGKEAYIALWDIEDVRVEDGKLTFRFARRVVDLI
jgi:hypothetical protein